MRRKRLWGYIASAIMIGGALFSQGTSAFAEDAAEETKTYTDVDKSKGVEYIKSGSSYIGFNLNGNSVVVKKSDSSTDEKTYVNIYNDKNMDGVVNDGEEMFSVEGETDVLLKCPVIYGVYEGYKTSEPMSITIDCEGFASVYGVYGGQTDGNVTMNIIDSAVVSGAVYAVKNGSAEDITINVKDSAAVNGAVYAVDEGSSGSVDFNVEDSAKVGGAAYVVQKAEITGDIDVDITGEAEVGVFNGLVSSHATGNFTFDAGDSTKCNYVYLVAGASTVDKDVTINASNSGDTPASIYAAQSGYMEGKTYTIGGDLTMNVKGGSYSYISGVGSGVYVKGNVSIKADNSKISSSFYGVSGGTVDGDVSVSLAGCEFNGCYVYGISSAKNVGENFSFETTKITGSGSSSIYGSCGTSIIGGNATVNIDGGTATYNNAYGLYQATVGGFADIDICNIKASAGYLYGVASSNISGTVDVDIIGYSGGYDVYGIDSSTIEGVTQLDVKGCTATSSIYGLYGTTSKYILSEGETGYANVVNIENSSVSSGSIYGVYGQTKGYDTMKLTMTNVTSNYYIYGINASSNGIYGDVCVIIDGANQTSTSGYIYGYYGSSNSSGDTKTDKLDVTVKNSKSGYQIYGAYLSDTSGDVNVTLDNNVCARMNAAYYLKTEGNCKIVADHINMSEDDNSVITDSNAGANEFSGLENSTISGNINIDISYIAFSNASIFASSRSSVSGDVNASLSNSVFSGKQSYNYFYLLSESNTSTDDGDTLSKGEVNIENCDFSNVTNMYLYNSSSSRRMADITMTGCTLPESYSLRVSDGVSGKVLMKIGNDCYYGGTMTLDSNLTIDGDLYVGTTYGGAALIVDKGVTVKAENIHIPTSSSVLNRGTIDGTILSDSEKEKGYMYVDGGTVTYENASDVLHIFYPVTLKSDSKAVSVSSNIGTESISGNSAMYAESGSEVTVKPTVNTGYSLEKVTFKGDSETSPNEATESSGTYTFEMPSEPCTVDVVTSANKITARKSVSDPSIILNKEYTAENPVYDMADVIISGDADNGEVLYDVDAEYALPEGLEFKDGLIYGTPTKEYESGKTVRINITGKNGTETSISLNLIVSKDGKPQSSYDGILDVDEDAKTICLNGSSVVINDIAIYVDDDKDGVADSETAMYSGDLSEYSIIGLNGVKNYKKNIKITVLGGTVGSIYGAKASTMTYSGGDAISVDVQGGTVGKVVLANTDTTVTGTVSLTSAGDSVSSCTAGSNVTGSLVNRNGAITISGTYDVDYEVDAASISIAQKGAAVFNKAVKLASDVGLETSASVEFADSLNATSITTMRNVSVKLDGDTNLGSILFSYSGCEMTIDENATLNVTGKVNIVKGSTVYHEGVVNCQEDKMSLNGAWIAAGTFADDVDVTAISGLYLKATLKGNLSGASVSVGGSYYETYKGATYVKTNSSLYVYYTDVQGYTTYITVGDAEPIETTGGSATVKSPSGAMTISVEYVANPITLTCRYASPVAKIGNEYTADNPLYDLSSIDISGDTTSKYGTPVKYRVKSGQVLPEGLALDGSMIVGTPSESAKACETAFVITGRNGSEAEISIAFAVTSDEIVENDINDMVSRSSSEINLNGTSVIITAAASDSSKSTIYLDENGDGYIDNNKPLLISGASEYNLSSYTIYGYKNTSTPCTKDISITMYGGKVKNIYGAYSKYSSSMVNVQNVKIHIVGGTVSASLYGTEKAVAKNVEVTVDGGIVSSYICGSSYSDIENVTFAFGGDAQMTGQSASLYVTQSGSVSGDVTAVIAPENNLYYYKNTSVNTAFNGVSSTKVAGNVTCTLNGNINAKRRAVVSYFATINGELNVEIKGGTFGTSYSSGEYSIIWNGSVGKLSVKAGTEDTVNGSFYVVNGCTVGAVSYEDSRAGSSGNVTMAGSSVTCNDSMYGLIDGNLTVGGAYTFDKSVNVKKLSTIDGADVKINEGVTLSADGTATLGGSVTNNGTLTTGSEAVVTGTFKNYGVWNMLGGVTVGQDSLIGQIDNYGEMTDPAGASNKLTLDSKDVTVINREGGVIRLKNLIGTGTFVNYGDTEVLTGGSISTGIDALTTSDMGISSSSIYYKVDVDYPAYCFTSSDTAPVRVTSSYSESSPVEGDDSVYIRGDMSFNVTVSGTLSDGMAVTSVVYGDGTTASAGSSNSVWTGKMPYAPVVVTVNIEKSGATAISLSKSEDTIPADGIQVGVPSTSDAPIYDLTKIVIENDDDTIEGAVVTYSLSSGQTLPSGLVLSNGRIYGTPKKASDEAATVKITVKGKNQTKAEFALTFEGVTKGVPTLSDKLEATGYAGNTLADVALPESDEGQYSWADSTVKVVAGADNKYAAYFIPNDTENYDWSKLSSDIGVYDEESGKVTVNILVNAKKQTPTFEIPEVTAVYGNTLADVSIPSADNGTFAWDADTSVSVGEVGENVFKATFTPNDTDCYEKVTGVEITVKVSPATAKYTQLVDELEVKEGSSLDDITLPSSEDGVYVWYTDRSTVVTGDGTYKLCFKPGDTANYDWTGVAGWNKAYKGVVFEVKVKAEHNFGDGYESGENGHWKECECGEKSEVEAHVWDEGKVTTEATEEAEGVKTYTCTTCGYAKTEKIAKLEHVYGTEYKSDETGHWTVCTGCGENSEVEAHAWDEGKVTTEATEEAEGVKTYTCTTCGYTKTETIEKPEHKHVYGTEYKSDETGHWTVCTGCGENSEIESHAWDEGKVTTEATEKSEGVKTYICTTCGYAKTEKIAKLEHKHVYGAAYKSNAKQHWQECAGCGYKSTVANHKLTYKSNAKQHWQECAGCGYKSTAANHKLTYKSNAKQHWQECTGCGYKSTVANHKLTYKSNAKQHWQECTGCGYKSTAANHKLTYKSNAKQHWQECAVCGVKTGKSNHAWNAGVVTKKSSASAAGVKTYTCKTCKKTRTEAIAKLISMTDKKIAVKGISDKKYTGAKITQSGMYVTYNGKKLKSGTDYTVSYMNNKNAGKATVVITGKGNYSGSLTKTFTIKIAKGSVYTKNGMKYKITYAPSKGTGSVALVGSKYGKTSAKVVNLKIASTIKLGGKTFKVTKIGSKAFKGYAKLQTVVIGANVKSIGASAFEGCKKLHTVNFGKQGKVTTIESKAFYKCIKLKTVKNGKSVTKIGDNAFSSCRSLAGVGFGKNVKSVGKKAFMGCKSLKKISLGNKLTTIGTSAFEGCSKLTSVTIGKKVRKIGGRAFKGCKSLKTVKVTSTSLRTVGKSAFSGIKSKAVVKIKSGKYSAYKAKIKKAGAPKKTVYKKL